MTAASLPAAVLERVTVRVDVGEPTAVATAVAGADAVVNFRLQTFSAIASGVSDVVVRNNSISALRFAERTRGYGMIGA